MENVSTLSNSKLVKSFLFEDYAFLFIKYLQIKSYVAIAMSGVELILGHRA